MRPPLPIDAGLIDQAKVGLVNQGGGLKRVVLALVPKMAGGEGAEFIVDQRHQLGRGRGAIAVFQADQKFCDLVRCQSPNYRRESSGDKP